MSPDPPSANLATLPLCVDTSNHKRRTIWAAWDNKDGRCGHGAALYKAGITIRAASLDNFEPYRRPLPLQNVQQQVPGQPRGTVQNVVIDPEEAQPVEPLEPRRGPRDHSMNTTARLAGW
jgi:hypothetical protein